MTDLYRLCLRIHRDERGAVSLETVLIIGAIALPVLIYLLKHGWPRIRAYFTRNVNTLQHESDHVIRGGSR